MIRKFCYELAIILTAVFCKATTRVGRLYQAIGMVAAWTCVIVTMAAITLPSYRVGALWAGLGAIAGYAVAGLLCAWEVSKRWDSAGSDHGANGTVTGI